MFTQKELIQVLRTKLGPDYHFRDTTDYTLSIDGLGAYLHHALKESEKIKAELAVVKDATDQLKEEFESCYLALEQAKDALQQRCLHTAVTQTALHGPSKLTCDVCGKVFNKGR